MEKLSFNEWMIYIHRQLNYPESKLKVYEESIGHKASISFHQQRVDGTTIHEFKRKKQDNTTPYSN
jgi:hypothetical protein